MSDLPAPEEAVEKNSVESRHTETYENLLKTINDLGIDKTNVSSRSSVVRKARGILEKRIRSGLTSRDKMEEFEKAVNAYSECCIELVGKEENTRAINEYLRKQLEKYVTMPAFYRIVEKELDEMIQKAAYMTAFDFDANYINSDTNEPTTFVRFLALPGGLRSRFVKIREERGYYENPTTQGIMIQYKRLEEKLEQLGILERMSQTQLYALLIISRMKYTGSLDFDDINENNISAIAAEAIRLTTPTEKLNVDDKDDKNVTSFEYIRFPNGYTPQQKAAAVREFNEASNFIRLYNAVSSDMQRVSDINAIGIEDEVSDNTLKELPIILEEALKENSLTQREAWVLSLRYGIALKGLDFSLTDLNVGKLKEVILNKLDEKKEIVPETVKRRFFAHLNVLAEKITINEDGSTEYEDEDKHNIYPATLSWTKREREDLEEYYRTQGLHDPFPFELTYEEISTILGLSGHRSNQILKKTLRKLRDKNNTTGSSLHEQFYES